MPLQLVVFEDQPDRVSATKAGTTVPDGRFFLDFTRPLSVIRWLGVRNRFVGVAVGLLVPVVHECEKHGGYVVSVNASEPYFRDIRSMWKTRFPSKGIAVENEVDGLKVIADFAAQFPQDAQS